MFVTFLQFSFLSIFYLHIDIEEKKMHLKKAITASKKRIQYDRILDVSSNLSGCLGALWSNSPSWHIQG